MLIAFQLLSREERKEDHTGSQQLLILPRDKGMDLLETIWSYDSMGIVYGKRSNRELKPFAKHVLHSQGNTENDILEDTGATIIFTA